MNNPDRWLSPPPSLINWTTGQFDQCTHRHSLKEWHFFAQSRKRRRSAIFNDAKTWSAWLSPLRLNEDLTSYTDPNHKTINHKTKKQARMTLEEENWIAWAYIFPIHLNQMDYGDSGLDWNKVYLHSCARGTVKFNFINHCFGKISFSIWPDFSSGAWQRRTFRAFVLE